jgi:ankyrin repeat protein
VDFLDLHGFEGLPSHHTKIDEALVLHADVHEGERVSFSSAQFSSPSVVFDEHPQSQTSAATFAADNGLMDLLHLLMDRGADLSPRDSVYSTPLHRACERGDIDMVVAILARSGKQSVNERDGAKLTPFHYAVKKGYLEIVELLMESGASIDLPFPKGE